MLHDRKPYAEPHPLKQLENKHGFRLAILPDSSVQGKHGRNINVVGSLFSINKTWAARRVAEYNTGGEK